MPGLGRETQKIVLIQFDFFYSDVKMTIGSGYDSIANPGILFLLAYFYRFVTVIMHFVPDCCPIYTCTSIRLTRQGNQPRCRKTGHEIDAS